MKRIGGIDELRGLLAIGIALFHFFAEGHYYGSWATHNATADWGSVIVYIFFIVSGICLYKSNSEVKLPHFYYKRWKSIFPSFYIAWISFYILRTVTTGNFNPDSASLWTIPLTVFGVDGYFLYLAPNFYLIGEWFLGAIIIIYLLYPLILYLFKNYFSWLIILLAVLTLLVSLSDNLFRVYDARNIICCIAGFVIGMVLGEKDYLLNNKYVLVVSMILSLLLVFFNLSSFLPQILLILLLSTSLFIVARYMLENMSANIVLNRMGGGVLLRYIGGISYQVFLVQHIVIIVFYKFFNPDRLLISLLFAL
ncbi:MAG: acyltransferase family protein [Bacteroidota bacterium]|nr:acyltransferase family protein [Bacteroidota bacterium]